MRPNLNLSHNCGDLILCLDKTIFKVYGNSLDPYVFQRDVTLRIWFLEIMRQLGVSQETHLPDKTKKGPFFPKWTTFVDYVMVKGAWRELFLLLTPYKLETVRPRNHDPEGFITKLKVDKGLGTFVHNFYYPKDVIRNISSFPEQDERKAKLKKDPNYDPLPNKPD